MRLGLQLGGNGMVEENKSIYLWVGYLVPAVEYLGENYLYKDDLYYEGTDTVNLTKENVLETINCWQASHTGDAAKVKGSSKGIYEHKRCARARAGVTFCQHARPVNWFQKLIKSQEKTHEHPAKTSVFKRCVHTTL